MTQYNGWKNYATWRVNLELFDGLTPLDFNENLSPRELSFELKEYAFNTIESESKGLAFDYAMAFLSDVDFDEIANSLISNQCQEDVA